MKTKQYLFCLLILFTITAKAQDNTLLLLDGVPQTMKINPAFRPNNSWYVSIPLAGDFGGQVYNSGFTWQQLVNDNLSSSLQNNNMAALSTSLQIVGAGIALDDLFFTIDISHNRMLSSSYSKSFMDFRKGNWDYANDVPLQYSTSGFSSNGFDYTEVALGFSKSLSGSTHIGFRLKYLAGASNFKIKKMDVDINTAPNGQINVDANTEVYTSGPDNVKFVDKGAFSFMNYNNNGPLNIGNNHGVALDIGVTSEVKIKDKNLLLGLALNNIGFIKWSKNATCHSINDSYSINGSDISSAILGNTSTTIIDYWEAILDSLDNHLKNQETLTKYTTMLPANIYLSAIYQHNRQIDIGVLLKGNYYPDKKLVAELGLSMAYNYNKDNSFAISYLATKNAYLNFGVGFVSKYKMVQLYMVTDNLISLLIPQNSKLISFRMGVNIIPAFNKSFKYYKSDYAPETGFY